MRSHESCLRMPRRVRRRVVALMMLFVAGTLAVAGATSAATDADAPRRLYPTVEIAQARRAARAGQSATPPLSYHGGVNGIGVTTGPPKVYLVFWGSQWGTQDPPGSFHFTNDAAGVAPRLQALFNGLGTSNELWSGVVTQYCEGVAPGSTVCPTSAPHIRIRAASWRGSGPIRRCRHLRPRPVMISA